ncbi:MAG TPA: methyltransferase domain-containing protein [Solirubrobacter sp.]|nr:methyltransferase domain-containing protein [Solirubrobacter sp.]
MDHRDVTRREFTRQSGEFARPDSFFADRRLLEWIAAHVPVGAGDVVLDVAGGAGHVGRRLAAQGAFAVVVDLTRQMLETGAAAVRADERRDVVFVEGDATALPFADEQFDVVVSRFAFHHFDEPARAAAEMARVARQGATVAVIDMVSEPGAAGARHNELERMRDPSHTRALEEPELLAALEAAGVRAAIVAEHRQALPAVPWLERGASPDAPVDELLAALEAEAGGGPATGLHATSGPDGLVVEQRWVIAAGRRATPASGTGG